MPTFKLGRGHDRFDLSLPPAYYGEVDIHGGRGHDHVDARGEPYLGGGGSNVSVHGDGGNDTLFIGGVWASDSSAYGGGGADLLSASGGYQFTLSGGSGADHLVSESASFGRSLGWAGEGTRMTGGSGRDTFALNSDTGSVGALHVTRPADPAALTEGETISGLIDVITDYRRGELIDLPGTQLLGDVLLRTGSGGAPWGYLATEAGEYGLVRGELTGGGHFVVAEDGPDVLLVYQQDDDSRVDGAVAILGGASADLLIG